MDTANRKIFGKQLKMCREQAGLTQLELALAVELKDGSSISRYEEGKDEIPKDRFEDIIRVLREHGAQEDYLSALRNLKGEQISDPLLDRVERLRHTSSPGFAKTDNAVFESALEDFVSNWERYNNPVSDIRRGMHDVATEALEKLIQSLHKQLPYQYQLDIRSHYWLGESLRLSGRFEEAINAFSEVITGADRFGDEELELKGKAFLLVGNTYRRLSNWEKAKENYHNSRNTYKSLENATGTSQDLNIADIERKLAGTHLYQGEPQEALKHCGLSLMISRERGDIERQRKVEQHQAWSDAMLGRWENALAIHKGVNESLSGEKGKSQLVIAKSYRYLADTYRMCGLFDKAEQAYNEAINLLNSPYAVNRQDARAAKV